MANAEFLAPLNAVELHETSEARIHVGEPNAAAVRGEVCSSNFTKELVNLTGLVVLSVNDDEAVCRLTHEQSSRAAANRGETEGTVACNVRVKSLEDSPHTGIPDVDSLVLVAGGYMQHIGGPGACKSIVTMAGKRLNGFSGLTVNNPGISRIANNYTKTTIWRGIRAVDSASKAVGCNELVCLAVENADGVIVRGNDGLWSVASAMLNNVNVVGYAVEMLRNTTFNLVVAVDFTLVSVFTTETTDNSHTMFGLHGRYFQRLSHRVRRNRLGKLKDSVLHIVERSDRVDLVTIDILHNVGCSHRHEVAELKMSHCGFELGIHVLGFEIILSVARSDGILEKIVLS